MFQVEEGYRVLKPNPNKLKERQEQSERKIRDLQREIRNSWRATKLSNETK